MKKFEMLDEMLKYFDSSELLEEVMRALDDNTASDVLNYIAHVRNIYIID